MHASVPSETPAAPPASLQISLELGGLQRPAGTDLLLLYTLSGFSELVINGLRRLKQEAGSIHIINAGEWYKITGLDNFAAVAFHIDLDYFTGIMPALSEKRFSTNAVGVDQDDYDALTILLSKSLKIFTSETEESPVLQGLIAHRIILLLLKKFQVLKKYDIYTLKTNDAVIQKLMAYIDQHSTERLSLQSLSALVHLNPQYLSRLFRRETGMTLTHYIARVRILSSEKDVLYGSLRAAEIAEKYGFPNTKSFYNAFRAAFGKTPGQHKADMQKETSSHLNFRLRCPSPFLYTREMVKRFIDTRDDQSVFDPPLNGDPDLSSTDVLEYSVECSTDEKSEPLRHTWSLDMGCLPHADASPLPFAMSVPLRLSDSASGQRPCYYEDAFGRPHYDFSAFDRCVAKALSCGMALTVELFFMPLQLAKYPQAFYLRQGAMSPPKDIERWLALVTALVRHLIVRFGADVMHAAQFSLWCDPTATPCWRGSREEFFDFAARTTRAVKVVDTRLHVGLTGLYPEAVTPEWLSALKAALDRQGVSFDFLGFTIPYLTRAPGSPETRYPFDAGAGYLLTDGNYPLHAVKECKSNLVQSGFTHTKFVLTGMRPSGLPSDLTQRTCFLNAYIIKSLLALAPLTDHVHFSSASHFSPASCELPPALSGEAFAGVKALRQPAYNVFCLLEKLGTHILRRGDNYVITAGEAGRYQVLCFNYCHYHRRMRTPEQLAALPPQSLYNAFERGDDIHLTIILKKINGRYRVRKYSLNTRCGAPFDAWLSLGAPERLTTEEVDYIKSKAVPGYATYTVSLDGEYTIFSSVAPHEVELFELTPQN